MQVGLNANICDKDTRRIAEALVSPLDKIGAEMSNDYGGVMEHLWIDVELLDDRGPHSFRFQTKVGGKSPNPLTGTQREFRNVGHYSVKPDIAELLYVPHDCVVDYVLRLIYRSTVVLVEKQSRLGGFDADRFRSDLFAVCTRLGYDMESAIGWD